MQSVAANAKNAIKAVNLAILAYTNAVEARETTFGPLYRSYRVWNPVRALDPSKHFSNLFNSYAQAFNKMYGRHGDLFERPFKRKEITDKEYFKTMVVYIHNNPVHHKFTEHAMDYPWSSYLTCVSIKPTHLQRDTVIGWFDNVANFKTAYDNPGDIPDLEKWLRL